MLSLSRFGVAKWWAVAFFWTPNLCLFPASLDALGFFPVVIAIISQLAFILYKGSQEDSVSNNSKDGYGDFVENSNEFALKEKLRLADSANQDVIKIIRGYKFHSNDCCALADVSFGVEKGQIFCLLGSSEAGKTSVFDIIKTKSSLTYGKAYIYGQEISPKAKSMYTLGFCLQSDALWDDFTVEEHFRIYGCMKGMPSKNIDEATAYFTEALGIKKYLKMPVNTLSGGTKRKLSVALAIFDRPDIIVLDEPTTGVDAVGRSQIWNLLKTLAEKKGSTVLISTHYMEDAELVADKLGILVNGSLVSIGNIADIRSSYQEYFLIVEEVSQGFKEILVSSLKKIIPEVSLDTTSDEKRMIFKVSFERMKFSKVCLELETLMADKKIGDFSINVKTLEQTFLDFASEQKKNLNDLQKKPEGLWSSLKSYSLPIVYTLFIIYYFIATF